MTGTLYGQFETCAPWRGAPHGASPACNRVLVPAAATPTTIEVPPGLYLAYAYLGPFYTLGQQQVDLRATDGETRFTLSALPLLPAGAVSADLHVHGAASFDSSLPDADRVLSFAAADVGVILATDHNILHDYAPIVQQLGLGSRMSTVTGVETTGHIPFLKIPESDFPLVIGPYNFWTWLVLTLELGLHLGQRAAPDYLAPALALRFRMYRTLGLELAGTRPVVGADRHPALAVLRLTYRFWSAAMVGRDSPPRPEAVPASR
jgi:hypothetical protein